MSELIPGQHDTMTAGNARPSLDSDAAARVPTAVEAALPDEAGGDVDASPALEDGRSPADGRSRPRRRVLIAAIVLAVGLPSAWGGYRWMFPPRVESGRSDVRIARTNGSVEPGESFVPEVDGGHPIDPALEIARKGLAHIRADVRDYTARLVKRERIDGKIGQEETMQVKIRNRKLEDGEVVIPFSVYMRFEKPAEAKDREVIWVEGANDGCLIGHEGSGLFKGYRAYLNPEGKLAMAGNRYPIMHVGLENLIERLIERGTRERDRGDCEVTFTEEVELNERMCHLIELRHPEKKPEYDFCLAQVYIDKQHFLPVRYAAYTWPEEEGGKPVLDEEYTYIDLKLNVGLTDADFDWKHPDYDFPSFTFP